MDVSASLRTLVLERHLLWVLVEADGTARLSAPYGVPLSELFGAREVPDWVAPLGSPLEKVVQCALDFIDRHRKESPPWAVLVSILKDPPGLAKTVRVLLPPERTRELEEAEHRLLRKLGMTVPMGDWARQDRAILYLVRQTGE